MASITWADVVALAPELSTINTTTQTDILAFTNAVLDVTKFDLEAGPTTRLARIYLAAHFGTLSKLGAAGPLIGESAGGLSRSYAMPIGKSQFLTTSYGRAFYQLIRPIARGPQVT